MSTLFLASLMIASSGHLAPTNLRCEYLTNPMGLEETHPRLSWVDTSAERGARQAAYRILVASSEKKLRDGQADLWDSGKVASDQSTQVAYAGSPLRSREDAYWKVQIWDSRSRRTESMGAAYWEMGLLQRADWKGQWIGMKKERSGPPSLVGSSWIWYSEADAKGEMPHGSVFLHRQFTVGDGKIESAALLISADDHFKATLNGKSAGSGDGWETIHTVDLTPFIKRGANDLVIEGMNDAGKAGVAAVAKIHFSKGPDQALVTDGRWQSAKRLGDPWQAPLVVGPVGMAPWGKPSAGVSNGPAPYLAKTFSAPSRAVKARIYASALGLYKLFVNDRAIGNDLLRPGWTDYAKRVQYQTYDVTGLIGRGANSIGMVLGNGWFCGRVGWTPGQNYGPQALGLVQLVLQYADGSRQQIVTDGSWRVGTGPITSDDLLDGESYDARKELPSLAVVAQHGVSPLVKPLTRIALNAQQSPSVRKIQELRPLTIKEIPKGSFIFDLGQNMVGWAKLKVQGPRGTKVRIRFAEMLNPDGSIYVTNLRSAKATDTYTLNGKGREVYEPTFTFHGFRYVELTGYPGKPGKSAVTGVVVGSANPIAGEFASSSPLVNKLAKNIFWGQRGNYVDVPTDCPQRDERLGWMGDAQIFARTATYNNDIAAFMTKWTRDVEDAQSPKGGFSDVSPRIVDQSDGAPAWGDAGVIVPWTIYQAYGDKRILAVHYDSMAKWIKYIDDANPNHIWVNRSNANFGDWLNVQDDTPREVLATAFFAHSTDLLCRSAKVLGKTADEIRYSKLLRLIKQAFNERFVSADGTIKGDTQTDYVLALHFDLLPKDKTAVAVDKLSHHILVDRKGHLSTGFVGVGYLCPTLTDFGKIDIAYRLLNTDTYPSWGYSIRQGATTIWERWDGWRADKGFQDPGMNSFNHYSLGSVGEWMYNWILGIDTDQSDPGFRHIILHPVPGGGLTWAKGSLDTIHGLIKSAWHRNADGAFTFDVTIPANTVATVFLESKDAKTVTESGRLAARSPGVHLISAIGGRFIAEIGSGTYHFRTMLPR